jgi:5-hydroxyisourate hydrolase-like protein (transthyretin family)
MRNIFIFLLSLFVFKTHAQQMQVTGHVVDTSGKKSLSNVAVSAIRLRDSVLLKHVRTNKDGDFELKGFLVDTFTLLVEHPEFEPKSIFIFGNKDNATIHIPSVRMNMKTKDLDEVIIYANKNPIFYRGDTLIYVADSFKVNENAVVEDLLKRLPGLTVDENGKITSQGKQISQVLVDGDEFFGSDPTIATKNLAAKGVESVAVYEKKNENAKAGEDDKIQVLDLRLKEDAKKGYFGKASAASDFSLTGADRTFYEGELLFNKFSSKQKISVFLLTSNTPRSNFGWGDMNKFGLDNERNNSGMSFWNQNGGFTNAGIPQTLKAGIYYSDKVGKNGKINANYSFYDNRLVAKQSSQSQYFLADSSYFTRDSVITSQINQSHRVSFTYTHKIDSLTNLELRPNISFDQGESTTNNINSFRDENFVQFFLTDITNGNISKGISSNSDAILRRKFKKPQRELELKYIYQFSNNQSDGALLSYSRAVLFEDTLDQKRKNNNAQNEHFGIATYREPIAKNWKIETEYLYEFGKLKQDRQTFNRGLNGDFNQLVGNLSNNFDNIRQQHRGTGSLIFEKGKHTATAGLGYRNISIENRNLILDTTIFQNISNLLPRASYVFKPSMSKRFNVFYATSSAPPSINDLQPVIDNSNPNRTQTGNPDLKPNYVHSLRFNFNSWQPLTGRYIWMGGNATLTDDAFANSTTFDNFGRQISQTVNVDGNISASVWAGGGWSLFKRKLEIRPDFNLFYNKYTNFINGQSNVTTMLSVKPGIDIEVKLDSLEINSGYDYTYQNPRSSLSAFSNQPFQIQYLYTNFKWTTRAKIFVKTELSYTINTNRAAGFNRNILLWNAEVSRFFLPTQNLIATIQLNDILNQNINLQRDINANVITDNFTRIISRYFLVKVTYKFNNNKTKEDEYKGWN